MTFTLSNVHAIDIRLVQSGNTLRLAKTPTEVTSGSECLEG